MTVSDLLLKVLHAHGVEQMFGIPGDAINDILDAVRRQDAVKYYQVRHEEVGAFAASAQAKLTGKLACCFGTSGPGAIHLLNGLYDAKMDHAPVVAITGQIGTGYIGTSYHQEVDTKHLFADVSCYSEEVSNPDQLPEVFQEACRAAIANRAVAHISMPTNISGQKVSVDTDRLATYSRPGKIMPDGTQCREAIDLLANSRKTAILAGVGCAGACDELTAFADHIGAPIVRTLRGKDVIDDDHPLCVGGVGLLGGSPGIHALEHCDVLLMVGTDFPYREFYPENAKFIQIDNVGTHIGRRHAVDAGLVGDAGPTLAMLQSELAREEDRSFLEDAQSRIEKWLDRQESKHTRDSEPIYPPRLIAEVSKAAPDDTVFLVDTGTSTAWCARHLRVGPNQRFQISGGLASMAFALPAAIGAQLAYPDRRVIGIAGDGAFGMLMADFVTAVRYKLPIIMVVLRNEKLGFITLEQESSGLPDFGTEIANPDYAKFAEACGGIGFSVSHPDEIGPALENALAANQPAVIDVAVDPNALIMPPKIELGQAANFTIAKLKEAFELL
ncbi:thiamine pyrophosphate-binding protein [Altererythrobacter sp.]|nr:thiamine pyrophosphate-binding protein [Altererythrobacter sp.]